jgi:hypothetical protein
MIDVLVLSDKQKFRLQQLLEDEQADELRNHRDFDRA